MAGLRCKQSYFKARLTLTTNIVLAQVRSTSVVKHIRLPVVPVRFASTCTVCVFLDACSCARACSCPCLRPCPRKPTRLFHLLRSGRQLVQVQRMSCQRVPYRGANPPPAGTNRGDLDGPSASYRPQGSSKPLRVLQFWHSPHQTLRF